ncbi:hypothetical protein GOODEAATRI_005665, partial [Goodea atripinnis]
MVVHPHPLSSVQFPLVLVSPQICHPDEKSFRKLNQGRFSPGCPPTATIPLSLLFLTVSGFGYPCSFSSYLGGARGVAGACSIYLHFGGGSPMGSDGWKTRGKWKGDVKEGCRIPSRVHLNPSCVSPVGLRGPALQGGETEGHGREEGGESSRVDRVWKDRMSRPLFSSQGI